MNEQPAILDVVALLADQPTHRLVRGQAGTIVEQLDADVFEVEFSDDEGRAYALVALQSDQVIILHHRPVKVA